MRISRSFTFEAAHRLPNMPPEHKCFRLHGHSFSVEIHLDGEVDATTGMVLDFADIECAMAPVLQQLDHSYLNEVQGLENPTSEIIARWIWENLAHELPHLALVVVRETCVTACSYDGS